MESHFYNVEVNWENSSKGLVCSPELNKENGVCIEVAAPPELPNGLEGIWSPEHLFVAAVSSCLMTTFVAIAENSSLEYKNFSCKARGRMDKVEGKVMISVIHLYPRVVVQSPKYIDKAARILKKAEDACLIAHSIKSKITMEITVDLEPNLLEAK